MPVNQYDQIEVYSDEDKGLSQSKLPEMETQEVDEIMSKMPNWLIRKGAGLLLGIVLMLLLFSYFIHYPDTREIDVEISSIIPPLKLITPSSGRIQELLVEDNQQVKANGVICILENPADYNSILTLKKVVTVLESSIPPVINVLDSIMEQNIQVGELQPSYVNLLNSLKQYHFALNNNLIEKKILELKIQSNYYDLLNEELLEKDSLLLLQLSLERKRFRIDSILKNENVISNSDFYNAQSNYLNKSITHKETDFSIIENQLQKRECIKSIIDLEQQKFIDEENLKSNINENVKKIAAELRAWEQKFVVKSPAKGRIIYFKTWRRNQYIESNEPIAMVVPESKEFICYGKLSLNGAGKVRVSQKVLIKLDAFPFEEFGVIVGRVKSISPVALDSFYKLEIELNELATARNNLIVDQPILRGKAEVITDDKTILSRIFEKLLSPNSTHL